MFSKVSHVVPSSTGPNPGKVFLMNLVRNWSLYLDRREIERPSTKMTNVKHMAIENLSLIVVLKKSFERFRVVATRKPPPLPARLGKLKNEFDEVTKDFLSIFISLLFCNYLFL